MVRRGRSEPAGKTRPASAGPGSPARRVSIRSCPRFRITSARRRIRARAVLQRLAGQHGDALRLATTLAEAPTLRCKANLLTRIDGLDELVGPLEAQSVYVDVPNPIAEVSR